MVENKLTVTPAKAISSPLSALPRSDFIPAPRSYPDLIYVSALGDTGAFTTVESYLISSSRRSYRDRATRLATARSTGDGEPRRVGHVRRRLLSCLHGCQSGISSPMCLLVYLRCPASQRASQRPYCLRGDPVSTCAPRRALQQLSYGMFQDPLSASMSLLPRTKLKGPQSRQLKLRTLIYNHISTREALPNISG